MSDNKSGESTPLDTRNLGNTKPNSRGKRWCFTLNHYSEEEYIDILERCYDTLSCKFYIVGKEMSQNGTPHLQGYIEFHKRKEFNSIKKWNERIHWEKAKGNEEQNFEYCSKEGDYVTNIKKRISRKERLLKKRYSNIEWKSWQQEIIDILETEPDSRSIHWYYDRKGNTGKTFLVKYLACKYDIVIADGKKDNVFNQIKTFLDNHEEDEDIKIVLLDIPRSSLGYINYNVIEKVKDGILYSGKYEGGLCVYDNPHVIIFANEPPNTYELSEDRWIIREITE